MGQCTDRPVLTLFLAALLVAPAWGIQPETPEPGELAEKPGKAEAPPAEDATDAEPGANMLGESSSPYLRMHADNPVHWREWNAETIALAKEQDKPIFLSIGYSTCYWCHVMEREVFMSPELAALLNERFISIKVDREEMPELDRVYMAATQLMTGGGGWPNSLFLTPEGEPFFGGTYIPLEDSAQRPGFLSITKEVNRFWQDSPDILRTEAGKVVAAMRQMLGGEGGSDVIIGFPRDVATRAFAALASRYDRLYGGFSTQPKFPSAYHFEFLFALADEGNTNAEEMALTSLRFIAAGGIHDHVGGGFHRYATDQAWRIPHFEKMLYNQAMIGRAMLEAYERTGDPEFRSAAEGAMRFVAERMTAPGGGFYAALDAQTDEVEGATYLWTREQIVGVLGEEDATALLTLFKLQEVPAPHEPAPEGSALYRLPTVGSASGELGFTHEAYMDRLDGLLARLREARDQRPQPLRDEKIIAGWNGLMIDALARASVTLEDEQWAELAEASAVFILDTLRGGRGQMARYAMDGKPVGTGVLDDYAMMVRGLISLHEATGEERWLEEAVRLTRTADELFAHPAGGYASGGVDDLLPARVRTAMDRALPNSNAIMAHALTDLARLTGDDSLLQHGAGLINAFMGEATLQPGAHVHLISALQRCAGAGGPIVFAEEREDPTNFGTNEDPVSVGARIVSAAGIKPGSAFNVVVDLGIARGWHIGASEPGSDLVKPTSVSVDADFPLEVLATLAPLPSGAKSLTLDGEELAVYAEKALWTIRVRLPEDAPVPAPGAGLRVVVSYQACDTSRCLEPVERVIALELPLGRMEP